jgi:hypothetical protein
MEGVRNPPRVFSPLQNILAYKFYWLIKTVLVKLEKALLNPECSICDPRFGRDGKRCGIE